MMKWRGVVAVLLFLVCGPFFSLHAQQFSSVSGVVSDKSGAAISGAAVTLENPGIGLHAVTTTDNVGHYQFLRLSPADGYQLSFAKDDFKTVVQSNLSFGVSSAETHNATLELERPGDGAGLCVDHACLGGFGTGNPDDHSRRNGGSDEAGAE